MDHPLGVQAATSAGLRFLSWFPHGVLACLALNQSGRFAPGAGDRNELRAQVVRPSAWESYGGQPWAMAQIWAQGQPSP